MKILRRTFVCYFYFVSWASFSLGVHVCVQNPNLEIHVPFGFIRIGWNGLNVFSAAEHALKRTWGVGA